MAVNPMALRSVSYTHLDVYKRQVKSGEINKILDPLKEAGIDSALFTDIKANPTIENVQNGVKAFQDAQADCIIAVGGGSCLLYTSRCV